MKKISRKKISFYITHGSFKKFKNIMFFILAAFTGLLFVGSFLILISFVFTHGIKGFSLKGFSITGKIWDPQAKSPKFGVANFLVGSLLVLVFSLIFSVPVAISSSIFINEFLPSHIKKIFYSFFELLSGIPSVVFGVFGFFAIFQLFHLNFSILSTSIVLALMSLPIIIFFTNLHIESIPKSYKLNSYALGATRTETVYKIIIVNSYRGIIAGILAAISRILGETIAVTLLIGGGTAFTTDINNSSSTITSIIALEFAEANSGWRDALFSLGSILLIFVTIINILTVLEGRWRRRRHGIK